MTKISSNPRSGNKVLLYIYCALMAIVLSATVGAWWTMRNAGVFIYFWVFLAAGGFFGLIMYGMTRNLADEVFDEGDSLLVRFRGLEERIPFSNIDDVKPWNARVPRVSLQLVTPCKFGAKVSFVPQKKGFALWTLDPFWMDSIVNDLLGRAQRAREYGGAA